MRLGSVQKSKSSKRTFKSCVGGKSNADNLSANSDIPFYLFVSKITKYALNENVGNHRLLVTRQIKPFTILNRKSFVIGRA